MALQEIYFLKSHQKSILALSYFRKGLPPNYRHRCSVSQPSSEWIGVVPLRHEHQESKLEKVRTES